jgi:MFS family permease
MPLYGHSIGLTPSAIGSVVSAIYMSSFLIQMVTPRAVARFGEERVLSASFAVAAASFLLVPFTGSAIALGAAACLFGLGFGSGQPVSTALLYNHAGRLRPGAALGLRLTINNVIRTLAPALMGTLGSAFGLLPMFFVTASLLGAGSLLSRPRTAKPDA